MACAKQTAIWKMVKDRQTEGGKKWDSAVLHRAQVSRASKRRPGTHTFPRRQQQPSRLPSLSNTRPLGVHFSSSSIYEPKKSSVPPPTEEEEQEQIEQIAAEKNLERTTNLQHLTDATYPSHNPFAETPIFAAQRYINANRVKPQKVVARIKYLQQETIRYLPAYNEPSSIGKSLEKCNINDKLMTKCGFSYKRVQCLYTEFLSFLGPQRGASKRSEPALSCKGLIKLLESRGIPAPGLVHRTLDALRKPGEGTDVNLRTFLKIIGIFEGCAKRLVAKTFFKMCSYPTEMTNRRLNPMELLRLITDGLPKAHRPLVGAILGELLDALQVRRPEDVPYAKFVNAVVGDENVNELFQALNPFARFYSASKAAKSNGALMHEVSSQ